MDRLSYYAARRIPFLFVIDYAKRNLFVEPIHQLRSIYFHTPLLRNYTPPPLVQSPRLLSKRPISFEGYRQAFHQVIAAIRAGQTYLLNLTFPTTISMDGDLEALFFTAQAKFKLYFQGRFVCFSPERFVSIDEEGIIRTFPMKGTIDASLPDAKERILADTKEMAEHTMVVDLLRNDLAMVAQRVRVTRFRYVDRIVAGKKELLQVSSQIEGRLPPDWRLHLGQIMDRLLPAGSVTGAPKKSTCAIIEEVEGYDRGFYTGVFGIFDGTRLDSAVMIRYVEAQGEELVYKSGGGITIDSDAKREYQELIEKVYLPVPKASDRPERQLQLDPREPLPGSQ
ncbi:MAG: aminodeoxychorismate synthase component I [Nitratiruptor sp.]|nr:aminodeoxychorismate synthase component I [Nitratiruptor sp.]NPA83454.1 aminodeoxychorismate synthase component I [Campylobacterota bacterium]